MAESDAWDDFDHLWGNMTSADRLRLVEKVYRGVCDRHGPYANTRPNCPCQDEAIVA